MKSLKDVPIVFLLIASIHSFSQSETVPVKHWIKDTKSPVDSIKMSALEQLCLHYLGKDSDSLKHFLHQLIVIAETTENAVMLSKAKTIESRNYASVRQFDSAMVRQREAMKLILGRGDADKSVGRHLVNCYMRYGYLLSEKRKYDSSDFYLNKAIELAIKLPDSLGLSDALSIQASTHYLKEEFTEALDYHQRALKIREKLKGDANQLIHSYMNIGHILSLFRNLKASNEYFVKGTELSETNKNFHYAAYGHVQLATNYYITKEYPKSERSYAKALDNYLKLTNWPKVWDTRDRLIKLYIKTEKWNQAKSLAQENLKTLARLEGSDSYAYRYAHTHLNMSMACFHTGNAALSERHIKMAEGVKIDSDWSFDYKNNLFLTFTEAYKTVKNFEKAYDFSIRYINVKDSFRNESNQKKIAELEKKFEAEKKEQEIKALQQTTAIQTLELEKKNAQLKNQLIIASLVLVLVVGGAYLFYRQYKLKRDKVGLELQERFLRSQLNPHFIFNSLIAIQNYLTNRPKEDAGEYLGMFSTLMRQILENSREEFIPLEEEINMLKHYLELQKIRFHEAFDYHIEVDENLDEEDTMVPPMFAQPFIENALEHGLFKKDGKNEIFVRFGVKSSEIVNLEITDSGIGIIGNEVKASGHKSLAKTITNERLEKMKVSYKADVKLITRNLTSDDGEVLGHRVSLDLPSKRAAS